MAIRQSPFRGSTGVDGRVVAFEPGLATAGCIARTREANRLTQLQIVPVGLSFEPGIVSRALPVYRGMAGVNFPAGLWPAGLWNEQVFLSGSTRCGNPFAQAILLYTAKSMFRAWKIPSFPE